MDECFLDILVDSVVLLDSREESSLRSRSPESDPASDQLSSERNHAPRSDKPLSGW